MADLKKIAEKSMRKVDDLRNGQRNEIAKLTECLDKYKAEIDSANSIMNVALSEGDNAKYLQALNEQRIAQDNIHFAQDRIALLEKISIDDKTAQAEVDALALEVDKACRKQMASLVGSMKKMLDDIREVMDDVNSAEDTMMEWLSDNGNPYPSQHIPYCKARLELKSLLQEFTSANGYDGKSKIQIYSDIANG